LTDLIFENIRAVNAEADGASDTVRISLDTKATVNIGEFSRHGKSRGLEAVKAIDHDMMTKVKVVPGGILETATGQPFVFFTGSSKTSDFIADGIDLWWKNRAEKSKHIKRIVINLDNGPECNGRRSQFLHRMVQFADSKGIEIRLAYYPPYHSKYNSIEHYWGGLERSWNGYLLDSVDTVLKRASNFVWRSMRTTTTLLETVYEKGKKLCGKEKQFLEKRLERSVTLPSYDIIIKPNMVI
jgi:transposase